MQTDELARQRASCRRRDSTRGRSRAARDLEGRQDVHLHDQVGLQVLERQARHAQSFADAINRFANPKMQSTGVQFLDIIQGAAEVLAGKATKVSGVKVAGTKLIVQLTRPSPDILARLAMPFFQAIDPTSPVRSTQTGSTPTHRAGRTSSRPGRRTARSR